jgi:hypothetical protein
LGNDEKFDIDMNDEVCEVCKRKKKKFTKLRPKSALIVGWIEQVQRYD